MVVAPYWWMTSGNTACAPILPLLDQGTSDAIQQFKTTCAGTSAGIEPFFLTAINALSCDTQGGDPPILSVSSSLNPSSSSSLPIKSPSSSALSSAAVENPVYKDQRNPPSSSMTSTSTSPVDSVETLDAPLSQSISTSTSTPSKPALLNPSSSEKTFVAYGEHFCILLLSVYFVW